MKKILIALFLTLFLLGNAYAVPLGVEFDPDQAAGTYYEQHTIYGYNAFGQANLSLESATSLDMITHQTFVGGADNNLLDNFDRFYENIKLDLINGLNITQNAGVDSTGDGLVNGFDNYLNQTTGDYNVILDIDLEGYIKDYVGGTDVTSITNPGGIADDSFTTVFDGGSADLLVDGNVAATFSFSSATQYAFDATSFGQSAQINMTFLWESFDSDYFPDLDLQYLIDNEFAIATALDQIYLVSDAIGAEEVVPNTDPKTYSEILLGFNETGADIKFSEVPEPTTMLLFGIGLLGLAGASRRKLS